MLRFALVLVTVLCAAPCYATLLFEQQSFHESYSNPQNGPPTLLGQVRLKDGPIPVTIFTTPLFGDADDGSVWTLNAQTAPSYGVDWPEVVAWGRDWPAGDGDATAVQWGFGINPVSTFLATKLRLVALGTGGVWDIASLTFTLDEFNQRPSGPGEPGEFYFQALGTVRIFGVPEPSAVLLAIIGLMFVHRTTRRCR